MRNPITGLLLCSTLLAVPAAGAVQAQQSNAPPNAVQGFSQNRNEPVNINADALEFQNEKKMATYKGHVHLVQGDTTLRCKTLIVYFDNDQASAPAGGQAPAVKSSAVDCAWGRENSQHGGDRAGDRGPEGSDRDRRQGALRLADEFGHAVGGERAVSSRSPRGRTWCAARVSWSISTPACRISKVVASRTPVRSGRQQGWQHQAGPGDRRQGDADSAAAETTLDQYGRAHQADFIECGPGLVESIQVSDYHRPGETRPARGANRRTSAANPKFARSRGGYGCELRVLKAALKSWSC